MAYKISIILYERRPKADGRFPVKLRVYHNSIAKLYSLGLDFTPAEFEEIYINANNKSFRDEKKKEAKNRLQSIERKAKKAAKKMKVFDFALFEMKLFRKSSDKKNVQYHFNNVIQDNIQNDKIGTAEGYKYALKSLASFVDRENTKDAKSKIDALAFEDITKDWLKKYEKFMLANGKSFTTISIYTRTLKAVFNNAIYLKDLHKDVYPFGSKKGKYKILKTRKVKKALKSFELKTLFNSDTITKEEAKAKAFWFFSYACNGMNIKDIALLKYSDINGDKFEYYRAKTFDKSTEKNTITIFLTDFTNGIIKEYGNNDQSGFVFDILNNENDSITQYKKIKNFTRYINDHIKRIALRNDLPSDLSTYWARHSFATNSMRKGASMEFISEALNHSDLSVTKNYFAGFEDEAKKEFAKGLLDF